ncbi:MAG: hypothetical protein LBD31_03790 [Treponema sp.]|jgi:hypothetical protein|nr:hypothetical protein [Treponema sp.]
MKKLLTFVLVAAVLGGAAFADDAKVMPKMVGRVYLAPTFSFAPGGYDKDGSYEKYDDGSVKLFNLGLAVEYGVIDWITAAVQWAPGWTPWSDTSAVTAPLGFDDSNVNGVADLFVGAKIQFLGPKAPLVTETFRAAIAPGVIIPLPGPDFPAEFKEAAQGNKATLSSMDNHVFATGARLYFDWQINDKFFINLYNETLVYPVKKDLNKDSPTLAVIKGQLLQNASTFATIIDAAITSGGGTSPGVPVLTPAVENAINAVDGEVNYKYKLTFEIEPVFTLPLGEGISLSAGLPVNYTFTPAPDYTVTVKAVNVGGTDIPGTQEMLEGYVLPSFSEGDPSHALSLKPNVSVFLTSTPLPLEFKVQYEIPLWGKNTMARHNLTLQIKAYFALPGAL